MTRYMTRIAQPHWLAWLVRRGGDRGGHHGRRLQPHRSSSGWASRPWVCGSRCDDAWRWPVWSLVVGCGRSSGWSPRTRPSSAGLATDVNSLIPLAVLTWCASPARRAAPPRRRGDCREELRSSIGRGRGVLRERRMVVFSVVSMGCGDLRRRRRTRSSWPRTGPASAVNTTAPRFTLTDQIRPALLAWASTRAHTVLTFLDPVCWTDCPLLAGQLRPSARPAGVRAPPLDLVAVAANPYHETLADVRHFMAQARPLAA